jgi:hypothetical protein
MIPTNHSPTESTLPTLKPVWSRDLPTGARGLALARERGWVLAWDDAGWLSLLNHAGSRQAQRHFPELLTAAAADDGTAYLAAGQNGQVWLLAPDLSPRWETKLVGRPTALALDSFGQYLAIGDVHGQVHIHDRTGNMISQVTLPRPLHFLVFVPTVPVLLGSADFGLVAALNLRGDQLWLDGLVANVGGLAVDAHGRQVLLACFSDGLNHYHHLGKKQERLVTSEPCRLVGQSFDGSRILTASLQNRLFLLTSQGKVVASQDMDRSIVGLALGPLGQECFVGLANGPVLCLECPHA